MSDGLTVSMDLAVSIETALSVGASGASLTLADKVAVRDTRGRLIIPGSHVKGKLRHTCEEIARSLGKAVCESPRAETMCPQLAGISAPCLICQLFGSPAYRSPLRFHDLVYVDPGLKEQGGGGRLDRVAHIRPGIGLDRHRKVVAEERLFFVETSPSAVAAIVQGAPDRRDNENLLAVFRHREAIAGTVQSVAQAKLLVAGLAFIRAWGGGKSRGLGWGRVRAVAQVGEERLLLDTLTGEGRLEGLEVLKQL
jgi:CRISPR/Cas system CSM-associated protein Csm3 (group 7 of RAMP superfamily)